MTEVGQETTVRVPGRRPIDTLTALEEAFAQRPGYVQRRVGSEELHVEGPYRSPALVAASVIAATVTFGLGLLLLMRRETESLRIRVSPQGSDSTLLQVFGATAPRTDELLTDLESSPEALADGGARAASAPSDAFSDPIVSPPVSPAAPPTGAHPNAPDEDATRVRHAPADDDATRVTGGVPAPVPPTLRITIDSGECFDVESAALLGRNPSPGAEDPEDVLLISVDDPDRSISKTHLTLWLVEGEIWIEDRGSTNGSQIAGVDGSLSPVEPGRRVFVQPGETVRFGDRSLSLEWVSRD